MKGKYSQTLADFPFLIRGVDPPGALELARDNVFYRNPSSIAHDAPDAQMVAENQTEIPNTRRKRVWVLVLSLCWD